MSNAPLIILQARVTSSRLPAKILLPVAGYPLFVLAALRAKKTGIDLIVATSDEPSDDVICTAAAKFHLPVCRGSLNDVLGRFLEATNGQSEDRIIVRLTADNIFPDGDFIDELVTTLVASGRATLRVQGGYQRMNRDGSMDAEPTPEQAADDMRAALLEQARLHHHVS